MIDKHQNDWTFRRTETDPIKSKRPRGKRNNIERTFDVSQRSSEEIAELEAKLRDIDNENVNLTSTIATMQQAEKESQRTLKMMEYQLYRNVMLQYRLTTRQNEVLMASPKPVQAAEGQVAALPEDLIALEEVVTEAGGTIQAEKIDEKGSADLSTQNKANTTALKEVVTEASGISEAKKINPICSTDVIQKNADITKKKGGFRFKRWLQKGAFRMRKVETAV